MDHEISGEEQKQRVEEKKHKHHHHGSMHLLEILQRSKTPNHSDTSSHSPHHSSADLLTPHHSHTLGFSKKTRPRGLSVKAQTNTNSLPIIKQSSSQQNKTSHDDFHVAKKTQHHHHHHHHHIPSLSFSSSSSSRRESHDHGGVDLSPGPVSPFLFSASEVPEITSFVISLYSNHRVSQISEFFCSFSNFGILKEQLFNECVARYQLASSTLEEGLPVSPHSKPITNSPSPTPLLSPSSQRSPLQDDDSSTSSSEITSRSDSSTSPPSSPSSSSSSSFSRKGSLQTPEDLIIVETWAREQCEAMCFILKIWLSLSGGLYERQDPKFFRTIASFLGKVKDHQMNHLKLQLLKSHSENEMDSAMPFYRSIVETGFLPKSKTNFCESFEVGLFRDYTVQELANGITFVMFRVFSSIGPSELHDGSWQGEARMERAPHINALSVLFNRISFLLVCEVLDAPSVHERVDNFTKIIELARSLKNMNNFEGMAAVLSVLSNACIQRLKPLWYSVDYKSLRRARKMEGYLAPQKNYKEYILLLEKATPPVLPWLAPKLRELRFMYDGNKKIVEGEKLNYEFMEMVGKSINGYLRYKTPMFHVPLPSLSLVQNFESVFNLDPDYVEDCLYEKSQSLFHGGNG